MSIIESTLNNFSFALILREVFSTFPHQYEYTKEGTIRRVERPICPCCGKPMIKNGFNSYTKKGLGTVKIGKWRCRKCDVSLEEDRTFWEDLKDEFFELLAHMTKILKDHKISYEGISDIFALIYPRSRETIRIQFKKSIDEAEIPIDTDVFIIHYDEQHPKKGRCQKFRLTLLDAITKKPIADELYDDKSPETIEKFMANHLDPDKPVIIITDLDRRYPGIFKRFFTNGYYHQSCVLHLNKRIVNDFPKKGTFQLEYLKYRLLNIFYDRTKELQYLKRLILKEEKKKEKAGYKQWLKRAWRSFRNHIHKWENRRRRRKENLKMRPYNGSVQVFNKLVDEYDDFPDKVQKRLDMISKNWKNLMMFHNFKDAPATNNAIENYFSTSLKTHQKKQYTSDEGIERQMKLSWMKRAGMLKYEGKTLLQIMIKFIPFRDPG
tara:strand:+ start:233 stop:1540 length:1308 start_codon:yes stop_codon:yes gene_type:complete